VRLAGHVSEGEVSFGSEAIGMPATSIRQQAIRRVTDRHPVGGVLITLRHPEGPHPVELLVITSHQGPPGQPGQTSPVYMVLS
jgi:hypothetical protein